MHQYPIESSVNAPQPDRRGLHSFGDPQPIVDQVLATCGSGTILQVGCGTGLLVRQLLTNGVDAQGVDLASASVVEANALAPGRYQVGSVLALPYRSESFDTIISIGSLEHLVGADISHALSELYRVAKRYVYLRLGAADSGNGRGRSWWDSRFFDAGFRRHPLLLTAVGFESLETEVGHATLLFEKIPPPAAKKYPLVALQAERDLHMDMLRESGRRSDAHIARYNLAKNYVRPNDVVLDLACGLGYGSAILWDGSEAAKVLGLDASAVAVEYARENFSPQRPTLEFGKGDVCELSAFSDTSIDMIVSFETIEHLEQPERFLKEVLRVLKPGGRFICSVPNLWVDDTGKDPNPHHQHVFDLNKLRTLVGGQLLVEQVFAQIAGGGMKLTDRPRRLTEVAAGTQAPTEEAEWWLLVAMKDPVAGSKAGYTETVFPTGLKEELNVTAFSRDYHNPWLVRSIVTLGQRCRSAALIQDIARRVLESAPAGSADVGAALCVCSYLQLDSKSPVLKDRDWLIDQLCRYIRCAENTPHAARWKISNQYVLAKLRLSAGQIAAARTAFWECATMNCLVFSPLLATKTIDAAFWAGWLAALQQQPDDARRAWKHGLQEAQRVLSGDWREIVGNPDRPVLFGLREATLVLDAATRCANGLYALDRLGQRPGYSSAQILYSLSRELNRHQAIVAEREYWVKSLSEGKVWLERQNAELQSWAKELDRARHWLEEQRSTWQHTAQQRETLTREQREWSQTLEQAKNWLDRQAANWRETAETRDRVIEEQRAWLTSLEHGKSWLEQERNRSQKLAEERSQTIEQQRRDLQKLTGEKDEAIARHRATVQSLEQMKAKLEQELCEARALAVKQEAAQRDQREITDLKREFQKQRDAFESKVTRREAHIRSLEKGFLHRVLVWLRLLPPPFIGEDDAGRDGGRRSVDGTAG